MKSNSPNQVDGDVQALIEHIKKWKESSTFFESVVEFNKRQSQIYEIALAALMAEPGIFEWRFKETDCAPATGWIAVPMERLEQAKQTFGDLVEYRFWFPTPPAQLLRPVELPEVDGWIEWSGGDCPVFAYSLVETKWSSGAIVEDCAGEFDWSFEDVSCNIIAYRVVKS